jgi:hypothetical protein
MLHQRHAAVNRPSARISPGLGPIAGLIVLIVLIGAPENARPGLGGGR